MDMTDAAVKRQAGIDRAFRAHERARILADRRAREAHKNAFEQQESARRAAMDAYMREIALAWCIYEASLPTLIDATAK